MLPIWLRKHGNCFPKTKNEKNTMKTQFGRMVFESFCGTNINCVGKTFQSRSTRFNKILTFSTKEALDHGIKYAYSTEKCELKSIQNSDTELVLGVDVV